MFTLIFILGVLMINPLLADAQQPVVHLEQYRLANGLTVILHQDQTIPVAAVVVMYHVGSKNEKPGRTGFAHLFEHVMFKGSEHVGDGEHFRLLQEIGANINGSTNEDRTNYFEVVPNNYLELALYLESDRMGSLLPAVNQQKLDNQRDVVKNERRQNYENQPYGTAGEKLSAALYPPEHPYSWPVIGSMSDLSAASLEDVKEFFRLYYAPNNACLAIAGNFEPAQTKGWIERYFGPIPAGQPIVRPNPSPVVLSEDKRLISEDRVQLPRLYLAWHGARRGTREDAVLDILTSILSSGKNSRLYRSLVFEKQIAQSVVAYTDASEIAGTVMMNVTAKPGKTLTEIEQAVGVVIDDVLANGVTEAEIEAALNSKEAQIINRLTTALGKANGLATSLTLSGTADAFNKELERFKGISPGEVLTTARRVLQAHKVVLSVVPEGKKDLAAGAPRPDRKESDR